MLGKRPFPRRGWPRLPALPENEILTQEICFFLVYFVQIGPHLRKIKFQTQEIQTKVFEIRLHLLLSWENENLCFNIKIILLKIMFMKMDDSATAECV